MTFLAASASPVDLDFTIVFQVIIFFILLFVLTFLLYRPLLGAIESRLSRTVGLKAHAQKILDAAASMTREYESKMADQKKEAEKFMTEMRQKTRADEEKILEKTKEESSRMIEEARLYISDLEKSLRSNIEPQVGEMARMLARKILPGL